MDIVVLYDKMFEIVVSTGCGDGYALSSDSYLEWGLGRDFHAFDFPVRDVFEQDAGAFGFSEVNHRAFLASE